MMKFVSLITLFQSEIRSRDRDLNVRPPQTHFSFGKYEQTPFTYDIHILREIFSENLRPIY